jgi:hypothetical protein
MGAIKASASVILLTWLVVSVCFAGPLRVLWRNKLFSVCLLYQQR